MAMHDNSPSPPALLERIRNWLRSDMLVLRWVFLTLYVVIVGGLFLMSWFGGIDRLFLLIFGSLTLGCQGLFIFGGGTMNLCRPIRKRRLWIPVLIATLMFSVLASGLLLALAELFHLLDSKLDTAIVVFWGILIANWLFWFIVFFLATRRWQRMNVLGRLIGALIGGSLAELLVTIPSYMIVSRRPGCFVGIASMYGILAGLHVMLFAFGPGMFLLFLRSRYRREQIAGPQQPVRPWFQFSMRTVLLVMLFVSLMSAWLAVGLQRARTRQRAADELYKVEAEINRLDGSVEFYYQDSPDSLDELLGDPGLFRIQGITGGARFGDVGLKYMRRFPRLENLDLSRTQVTDAGLRHLEAFPNLSYLDLNGTQITDAGLIHLRGLSHLESLKLNGTQVTDAGLKHLKGLTGLWNLELSGTPVTDVGLKHLNGLTDLLTLDLSGTRVTDAGVKKLQTALPELVDGITQTSKTPK